ncbi:ABC transporter permease, partial [bacterium]|nr:ABC transporter permease [bacterium]
NAEKQLHAGDVDLILSIPNNFERDLMREDQAKIQLLINGINNAFAQTAMAYSRGVIADLNREIIIENLAVKPVGIVPRIKTRTRYWYNPELNYKIYMAPGILAILITVIGFLLSGLNLVREKEMGTSEQINVTPVKKHEFILGKMVPFLVVGIIDFTFGLLLARLVYAMPIEGNIFVLLLSTVIYLIAIMGLGLFLSTFANTQQQYLFVCFFFQLIFVLMSGIFTPADSMPDWAQTINLANPSAYFIRILRMLLLKGASLRDISRDLLSLGFIAVVTTIAASVKYKKIN